MKLSLSFVFFIFLRKKSKSCD